MPVAATKGDRQPHAGPTSVTCNHIATKKMNPLLDDDELGIYRVILFKTNVDYKVARHRADPPICGLLSRLGLSVKTEEYPETHEKSSIRKSACEHSAASISATSRTADLQCES